MQNRRALFIQSVQIFFVLLNSLAGKTLTPGNFCPDGINLPDDLLILELDRPFDGTLQVSSEPLRNARAQLGK